MRGKKTKYIVLEELFEGEWSDFGHYPENNIFSMATLDQEIWDAKLSGREWRTYTEYK